MIALFAGLMAGLIHVFSGPDHLVAVAPLAAHRHRDTWRTGLRWGLGHSAGVVLVGALLLGLRGLLPIEQMSSWAERLVGIMLIGIGIWGLRRAWPNHIHSHTHQHDGSSHIHVHVHRTSDAPSHSNGTAHRHSHAAFAVGTLHGLAGSSHFWGVLPALAFPTLPQASTYLVAYGAGTALAMASFAAVIAAVSRSMSSSGTRAYRYLMGTCSGLAIITGSYWLVV